MFAYCVGDDSISSDDPRMSRSKRRRKTCNPRRRIQQVGLPVGNRDDGAGAQSPPLQPVSPQYGAQSPPLPPVSPPYGAQCPPLPPVAPQAEPVSSNDFLQSDNDDWDLNTQPVRAPSVRMYDPVADPLTECLDDDTQVPERSYDPEDDWEYEAPTEDQQQYWNQEQPYNNYQLQFRELLTVTLEHAAETKVAPASSTFQNVAETNVLPPASSTFQNVLSTIAQVPTSAQLESLLTTIKQVPVSHAVEQNHEVPTVSMQTSTELTAAYLSICSPSPTVPVHSNHQAQSEPISSNDCLQPDSDNWDYNPQWDGDELIPIEESDSDNWDDNPQWDGDELIPVEESDNDNCDYNTH